MQFQNMNVTALQKAAECVLGTNGAEVIGKVYLSLNAAMEEAYQDGFRAGFMQAEGDFARQYNEGYEEGVDDGDLSGYIEGANDGYCEGVQDARLNPGLADETVANIIAADEALVAEEAYDDAFNECPRIHEYPEDTDWEVLFEADPIYDEIEADSGDEA